MVFGELRVNPRAEVRELSGRRILVVGAARSGLAAARLLARAGARPVVIDAKPEEELSGAARELERIGAEFYGGRNGLEGLGEFDLAVVSPGVPPGAPVMEAIRQAGIEWVSELELGWWFWAGPVAAVTGTNGKGTCCRLLSGIMSAAGIEHILAGNIGFPLSDFAARGCGGACVAEVSSFQLYGCRQFAPQVAVLLNISPDHFDWHGSLDEYVSAKRRIFERQRPEDAAVIVRDDELARRQEDAVRGRLLWVGSGEGCVVRVRGRRVEANLGDFCGSIELSRPLARHHMVDLAAAAAAGFELGRLCGRKADEIAGAVERAAAAIGRARFSRAHPPPLKPPPQRKLTISPPPLPPPEPARRTAAQSPPAPRWIPRCSTRP